jgi:transposase-like protein
VDDQTEDKLVECKETVKELREENAELRESAESFGALAERLNRANRAQSGGSSVPCPRCGRERHVEVTPPTARGGDLHCTYCGNTWTGQPKS